MKILSVETAMKKKPRTEVVDLFKARMQQRMVKKYNKFGTVEARLAKMGEKIDTIVNGKKETTNTAKNGDYVVKNPSGEQYIISGDKFNSRYQLQNRSIGWSLYNATGSCWAFKYEGPKFTFEAPWGEDMLVETGDYIAVAGIDNLDDIYRIEKNSFKQTYK